MTAFDWDDEKARRNLKKHGVTFEEAQTVFEDSHARIDDPDHSAGEHRELLIGYSAEQRLLLVSFVQRGEIIRLVSARSVDARERKHYEEENL